MKNSKFYAWGNLIVIFFSCILLQVVMNGVFGDVKIAPNLLMCVSVFVTMLFGDEYRTIIVSCLFGFIYDLIYAQLIGATTLSLLAVMILICIIKIYFNVENVWNLILTCLVCTILYVCTYWIVTYISNSPYSFLYSINSIKFQLVSNEIILVSLFYLLRKKIIKHHRDRYF